MISGNEAGLNIVIVLKLTSSTCCLFLYRCDDTNIVSPTQYETDNRRWERGCIRGLKMCCPFISIINNFSLANIEKPFLLANDLGDVSLDINYFACKISVFKHQSRNLRMLGLNTKIFGQTFLCCCCSAIYNADSST
ncbi:uncharacterized protein LOC130614687 [Hydractinia symbiolongicarpus]|uniref:uncharacterized protein LOC130614687 n=1 Tax=Hydractinia symbiolongicarpus TaxID=13093 RepID=UPI00254BF4E6|nr:uncharacterized protein LOC130614687 [Hydractinia symbiolongicarpus]